MTRSTGTCPTCTDGEVISWTDPTWLAAAHSWIRAQFDRLGIVATGPIEQPHVRPWSTVMRVPTGGRPVWFKANRAAEAHEAVVVDVLSRRRPDYVDVPLAVDLEHGWMLLPDAGNRLREIVQRDRDLECWTEILHRYGQLQIAVAADADELVARGTPERRLAAIPGQFQRLVEDGPLYGDLVKAARTVR